METENMNMYAQGMKILSDGITMGEPNRWWAVRFKSQDDKDLFLLKHRDIKRDAEGNPTTAWLYCTETLIAESEHVEEYALSSMER